MDKAELLKKINALANQGIGGEKKNAQALLDRLMKKYGITELDIESCEVNYELIPFKSDVGKKLLCQIIYMIMGMVDTYKSKGIRSCIGVYCTQAERIEIEATYNFYYAAYLKEQKLFVSAFIQKNRLFPPEDKTGDTSKGCQYTLEELLKISQFTEGIDRRHMRKMIESEARK